VVFNFMFEFINRAAGMSTPITVQGLDELMPQNNWQQRLREAQERAGFYELTMDDRKDVLVGCFGDSLKAIGGYLYVAEITVLRPLTDRALYCLVYGSRHESGIAVFRDCQMAALRTQAELRAQGKVKDMATRSGQSELFDTMLDMAPDRTAEVQALAIKQARDMLCTLVPKSPDYMSYRNLWATVLSHHAVRRIEINTLCAAMKKSGELLFPDWEEGRKVPQDHYRVQRP
jgi:hypothetical protein